jgi:hypothetical protein
VNQSPDIRTDIQILPLLAVLVAGSLLLGAAGCYAVGSGEVVSTARPDFFYFVLGLPNLVLPEIILLAVGGTTVGFVLADAARHRRLGWFAGMLLLALLWALTLMLVVIWPSTFDPAANGYSTVVSFAGVPFLLAVLGLRYTRAYLVPPAAAAAKERTPRSGVWQQVVAELAAAALVLIGLPGLLWLLSYFPDPLFNYPEPPLYQGIGYLANQAVWQALQLVFIWAVGIFALVDAARRRRWGWLGLLVVPILAGMVWVGACGILMTWDVARLLPIPVALYLASLLAPVAATLLVALPALLYAWLSAPRAEAAPRM